MKFIVIVLLFVSCFGNIKKQDTQRLYPEDEKFLVLFSDVNQKIHGDISLRNELENFNIETYKNILKSSRSQRPSALKEQLNDFKEMDVHVFKTSFIVCAYSKERKFAVCDNAMCSTVEKYAYVESGEIIKKWKNTLNFESCPRL